ncbi:MAG: S8 family serine peptidase [Verrucomicrobiaceae bacterium]|nr:S8 family serine peptidase [Verrucomicrobiaceae bacterium]
MKSSTRHLLGISAVVAAFLFSFLPTAFPPQKKIASAASESPATSSIATSNSRLRQQTSKPVFEPKPANPLSQTGLPLQLLEILDQRELMLLPDGNKVRSWLVKTDFDHPVLRVDYFLNSKSDQVDRVQTSVADHVLVALKEGVDIDIALAAIQRAGFPSAKRISASSSVLVKLPSHDLDAAPRAQKILTRLTNFVSAAEMDGLGATASIPNDTHFPTQWGLHSPIGYQGGRSDADIDAPEAWDVLPPLPAFPIVVIDSGLNYNHPDLVGALWTNPGEIPGNSIDDDFNGFVDDVNGWDFVNNDNNPADDNGHGTEVSGVMSATRNNGIGIAGIFSGSKIIPIKALGFTGVGTNSNLVASLAYARAINAKLVNISLHNYPLSSSVSAEIIAGQTSGMLYVIAAGNQSYDNDLTPNYPSSYPQSNIIAVTSSDKLDFIYSGSYNPANWGLSSVDLFAPGWNIPSTSLSNGYTTTTGTSMATPHVTAAAAIAWALTPGWTAGQIKSAILSTGDPKQFLDEITVTGKRLNLKRLVDAVRSSISVNQPSSTPLVDGKSTRSFGTIAAGLSNTLTFTIENGGPGDLTDIVVTLDGTHASDFSTTQPLQTQFAAGDSTTFDVTFTPSDAGTRSATLHVTSNAPIGNPFDIKLSGIGTVPPTLTRQPASLAVNPNGTARFSVTTGGSNPKIYEWQMYDPNTTSWVPVPGGPNSATLTLTRITEAAEGSYRVSISNSAGNIISDPATLTVNNPVVIDTEPVALVANSGDSATFSVAVSATTNLPVTYQWTKNNAVVQGATSDVLVIPNVQTPLGGDYRCKVRNVVGTSTSIPARLTVVDGATRSMPVMAGSKTLVLSPTCSGVDAATLYVWKKDGTPVVPDATHLLSGAKLTIKDVQFADAADYVCEVTVAAGMIESGATKVIVYDSAPELAGSPVLPVDLPDGIVGGTYNFSIPTLLDPSATKTPSTYAAKGLPSGLKCDSATGVISGKPTVNLATDKTYSVQLTVKNLKGSLVIPATLIMKPLTTNLAGVYVGYIERVEGLNAGQGGRIDLTILGTSAYSGKVTLGAAVSAFKGAMDTTIGSTDASATITIPRKAPLTALTLAFTIDTTSNRLTLATVSDSSGSPTVATIEGWRRIWSATNPATAYLGYHTFAIEPPTGADASVPAGTGFGSFSIASASTGAAVVSGRMADDAVLSTSSFVGPLGEVLIFRVDAKTDSIVGYIQMTAGTPPLNADSTIGGMGTVTWRRETQPASSRVYEAGFGLTAPTEMDAVGGRYIPPTKPLIILGVTDDGSTDNAQLSFREAELGNTTLNPLPTPDATLRLVSPATAKFTPPTPRPVSLAINSKTGSFTGRFTLVDPNVLAPTKTISRIVNFKGLVVMGGGIPRGAGYFLLPRRPANSGETPSNTEQLSGQVILEATP